MKYPAAVGVVDLFTGSAGKRTLKYRDVPAAARVRQLNTSPNQARFKARAGHEVLDRSLSRH